MKQIKRRITLKRSVNKKDNRKGNNPKGRPQIYNDMIGAYICRELVLGRTITSICKDENVPSLPTVFNWLNRLHPCYCEDFAKSYIEARRLQAEVLADQNLDIADNQDVREYTERSYNAAGKLTHKKVIQKDMINAKALQIETRWKAARYLAPNKFSDKLQLTGNEGKDLIPITPTKVVFNLIKANPE